MQTLNLIMYFLRLYPLRSLVMIFCMFASGFAEGMSLVTLMPVLQIFMDKGGASDSTALIIINNFLEVFSLKPTLGVLLIMVALGMIFKSLFLFTANLITGYTVAYVTSDLRLTLIDVLMSAIWSYFVKQPTGYFSNAVSSEISRVAAAYQHAALLLTYIIDSSFTRNNPPTTTTITSAVVATSKYIKRKTSFSIKEYHTYKHIADLVLYSLFIRGT